MEMVTARGRAMGVEGLPWPDRCGFSPILSEGGPARVITATAALDGEIHLPYECFQGQIGSAKMMGKFGDAFHRISTAARWRLCQIYVTLL